MGSALNLRAQTWRTVGCKPGMLCIHDPLTMMTLPRDTALVTHGWLVRCWPCQYQRAGGTGVMNLPFHMDKVFVLRSWDLLQSYPDHCVDCGVELQVFKGDLV
jgi:hypothetical protein